jgi:TMEM175 potassium channel family protein
VSQTSSRAEAFSDGVLAIAITLLVLEIRVPDVPRDSTLARELFHLWPKYAVFAISFVTIGIMWINHHAMFDRVSAVDRRLLSLNLLLLLSISFVPFPTAVLGDYVRDADAGHAAAALYGANMLLVGIGFLALWRYLLVHPELRSPELSDDGVRQALRRTIIGPITYAASIVVALISAPAALVLFAVLAGYFATGYVPALRK